MISLTNVDPELTAPECDFLIDVLTLTRENDTNKMDLSLIHISEPTRRYAIEYCVVWL